MGRAVPSLVVKRLGREVDHLPPIFFPRLRISVPSWCFVKHTDNLPLGYEIFVFYCGVWSSNSLFTNSPITRLFLVGATAGRDVSGGVGCEGSGVTGVVTPHSATRQCPRSEKIFK